MRADSDGGLRIIRWAGGLLVALTAVGAVLLMAAPAASAHASLLFTSPAADSAVPASPAAIILTFDEAVALSGPPVILTGAGGHRIRVGAARQSGGRRVVTVPVAGRLPHGTYTVAWQIISSDGDPVNSVFRFAVGPAPAALSSTGPAQRSTPGLWPLAVARWFLFAGLAAALGGLAARGLARWYGRTGPGGLPPPWALRASLLGLAASVALAALQLGGGNLAAGLAHPSLPRLLSSTPGVIAGVEIVSFAAAAMVLWLGRPGWSVLPLLAVVAAEGIRAHPQSIVPVGGAMLTWGHLLPAALWAGMLFYVVRAALAWRANPSAVQALVRLYARVAAWLFAAVVATGVVSALVLVPLAGLFTTSYGRVLLVKAALVAAAAALAVAGRLWLRHRPRPGDGPALATRVESGALAAVLAAAALLVALPAPATPGQPLPFPPPASGPVVPLGGRAGEVGIYATASAGQLVLGLSAPETSESDTRSQRYSVAVILASPGRPARTLTTRGCGPGCVVAPARWASGDNLLTLRISADGFAGGMVALDIPWPPAPGGRLLRRAAAALRATPTLAVTERVTSDTALGPGTAHQIRISGSRFLGTEPYKTGIAPVTVEAPGTPGQTRLLLGYPAQSIWAQLTLGAGDKIVAETLVDPDHLITRDFAYPENGAR